ncbi:Receptor-type guanylate cyclase Gyc76C [Frankliniella fusca]|uniref:Guanylate cyclase n=1 Tax=Frankliniella fusca TaxID=407009 RepID=A0AAE1GX48_9NEOP|nr:Receptor-type guanylate cyclase Gyc76C [Frankliniella fusca]
MSPGPVGALLALCCLLACLLDTASPQALQALHLQAQTSALTRQVHQAPTPAPAKKNITIGYLTAVKGDLKDRQGLAVSGALTMAIEEINNNTKLLPWVNLNLRWNDTRGDTVITTRCIVDMLCDGVSAFIGPEGSCHVEAIVAQSRNIPMISYKCSDYKASMASTFARTEPPDLQVTKSLISLLRYYHWSKFTLLHEETWSTVAASLHDQAVSNNMTIQEQLEVTDSHKCCEEKLKCCQFNYWYRLVQNTKNNTRIYVFLGNPNLLIDLMGAMQTLRLFDQGEYMVIYVDMLTHSPREAVKYLWKVEDYNKRFDCSLDEGFEKRAKSLLVIVSSPPTYDFQNFTERHVSIYAAYLYDSIMLYAHALDKVLRNYLHQKGGPLTDEEIDRIASNGTHIIENIRNQTYISATGATIKIDEQGDSEGNFSVLALKPYNFQLNNFTCAFHMIPVGQFHHQGKSPEYKLISPNNQIDWPGGHKPEDEPNCGFNNELCPKDHSHQGGVVAAGTLAVLLFCAIVVTVSIYRKWKIEQEIEGLLWKVDPTEIRGYYQTDMVSSPSKLSLVSATSYESRYGPQVFAATAQYKSIAVRIKELKFSKKKDISREIMKEMRLLREIRHDNINLFLGAAIEPMRILLLTDYCAKGSLYDIVENEDIKLDKLFIASLVHDLIKGMLYIHSSVLVCHGNLKSSNCVVTSRWVLKITDFGLHELRHSAESGSIGEHQYFRNQFWKAPELLRDSSISIRGTQKGDIYAFAIILYEILGRHGPFGIHNMEPKEIVDLVKNPPPSGPYRPDVDMLRDNDNECPEYILQCMQDCWAENPEHRPDFHAIRSRLKAMKEGKYRNIIDQMMDMMEKYAYNLEDLVSERTRQLFEEKQKTEDLLHRMLPAPVADRLTRGIGVEPESYDLVTIYFSDIVGFTAMSAESTPLQVVNFLNDLYTLFDRIIRGYDVYKVETIGDAYMVVSGLPLKNVDRHAGEIASMSLELLDAVKNHRIAHRPNDTLKLRIGIHTGPVAAGVVGLTMPRYCLFGDTVNTASRMESNGEALKIHISPQCKSALDKLGGYITEERGLVNMKGKGEVMTYWLTGATEQAIQKREVDIADLPPLFCRPRRSPKLNTDSRHASLCGFGGIPGAGSRRQSSVPRGNSQDVDSSSTLGLGGVSAGGSVLGGVLGGTSGNLPAVVAGSLNNSSNNSPSGRPFRRVQIASGGDATSSKSTLNSQTLQDNKPEDLSQTQIRTRRLLSSVASSSATAGYTSGSDDETDLSKCGPVRESRSLDPFPTDLELEKLPNKQPHLCEVRRRGTRSLEHCDLLDRVRPVSDIPFPSHKNNHRTFPNGAVSGVNPSAIAGASSEDVRVPLLAPADSLIPRGAVLVPTKRWRSLEQLKPDSTVNNNPICLGDGKKTDVRGSIKSWLFGLFNGNGLRSSETSLRKGINSGYNDLQSEKESIV